MIGTTEWVECKEKAVGLLQIGYGIRDYYWRDYWSNIGGNYWIIALGENNRI